MMASLALSTVALLAACGGSSTSNNPVASYTTLQVFGDRAGVARGTGNDGSQSLVITPEVTAVVANASTVTASQIDAIQFSDFPIVRTLSTNANLRSGTITTNGITFNVRAVEDLGGEAAIMLAEVPNVTNFLVVAGSQYGGAPTGEFTYSGTMAMGRRVVNPDPEYGSFSMSADFSNQTFTYDGRTISNRVEGSGVLDTTTGRFTTNTLDITTGGVSGIKRGGTMHGQTHGSSAQSVSGVFHTDEISPLYAGAFVGSR